MRRKTVLVVLVVLLLTTPWASAAPRQGRGGPVTAFGILVPDVLSQAWSFLTGGWRKSGCQIDPDGRCVTSATPTSSVDAGCNIDPNGSQCRLGSAQLTDIGCNIDPDGRCHQ
jgi:hypothetical protein